MIFRDKCELCCSSNKQILISRDFTDLSILDFIQGYYNNRISVSVFDGGYYELAKCSNCGFIWQTYILNNENMQRLYSDWISKTDSLNKKKNADIEFYRKYASQVYFIALLFDKKPADINILDYGMGWGYWCMMAKAFGYQVHGYEVSKDRIKYARNNAINILEDSLELCRYRYDFININHVLEHIINPVQVLENLYQVLNPNGVIRISVPDGASIEGQVFDENWKASKNAVHPLEHINCFTGSTLIKLGEAAGMEYFTKDSNTTLYFKKKGGVAGKLNEHEQIQLFDNNSLLKDILNSYSYKIGRTITAPVRILKNLFYKK